MIALVLVVLLSSLYLLYNYLLPHKQNIPSSIPRPPAVPFFGHALRFTSTSAIMKMFSEYTREYGGIYQLQMGPFEKSVMLTSAETVEPLLADSKQLRKSKDYTFLHSWLGAGLLNSEGARWKRNRRIITPTFHFKVLEDFLESFNAKGEILMEKLKGECGREAFNIVPYLSLFTLDAICETAMGVSIDAQEDPDSEYVKSVKEMCRIVAERGNSLIERSDFLYRFTNNYAKERKALNTLHGFTTSVIKKRKQQISHCDSKDEEVENELGIKKRKAFLDLLLDFSQKEQDPLTDEELRNEVDTFMFAGHDTTSTLLSFAVYCLANNPHVQKAAYEEQVSVFGDDMTRDAKFADLQNMPYLEMVIKETLRVYPSAPFISRTLVEDLKIGDKTISKGVQVGVFIYGIHHDPKIYPEPEKFIPERFAGTTNRSPYAYIPFSAGARNCIGQKFALVEAKATLSKLLRSFEVLPATPKHELELAFEVVLTSKNGVLVALKSR